MQQTDGRGHAEDVNMSVPIDLLTPILDELLTFGRLNRPARPWLGVYSTENAGRVVIADVAETGPAAKAGLRTGDIVASVRDASVDTLGEFYREIWGCGPAGTEIPIEDSAAPIRSAGGKIVGAVIVFHDVTEGRRTERAINTCRLARTLPS